MTGPAALVLAGSRPGAPDPVALAEGVAHKALVDVGGAPMLARVVEALRQAGSGTIAVSANEPAVVALAQALGCIVLPTGRGPSASVAAAFDRLGAPMLVTTADHALLRPEWIHDFLADTPDDADVAVLLAHRDAVERALPGTRRTYLKLADGGWSGCNLFLLASPRAEAAIATWSAVEADRKRPWRIAARLGVGTLWRYATGKLTMTEAIAGLGRRIGITAAAVPARDGLAAVDVDKPEDLRQVRALVA
ncbi:CTP:molybdopterin cytidylyltransferase MocA [Novosphingobium chloroacetimidivorans]|uniref:CTP:molybdopterin cytidylyltransferase MocA n=1 Tax=Novosphingobium chloroacetimidivorans TaxID=1428314 RepID=A0A7W7NW90_9SPHN|nr:nucleotidyltransferase family protein [Novosphingobium chloroacetimidivorans]MBB4857915.1 CTP:molybdopterin cytidylyltransferase MocA [Novosphingobium chloroacetimidivorans]